MQKKLDVIIGEKTILRPITLEDTELIVRWRNRPFVRENFIFRELFTAQMHINWMNTKVKTGEVIQYIIEEKERRVPIGSVYIRDINLEHRSAEYGIFIGEDEYIGKGYGTETAELFIKFAFEILGLHRVCLRVLKGNDIAYKSYEKVGFKIEGVAHEMVRIDGRYQDVIFMSIINQKEVIKNE